MWTDKPVLRGGKSLLVPVLICAALCAAFIRTGFLSLFFLVPLGFCAAAFGPAAAWLSFIFAAIGNAVLSAGLSFRYGLGLAGAGLAAAGFEILLFTVLVLGFTWIMAGNPPYSLPFIPRARTAFRFIAASIAGSLVMLGMIYSIGKDENFLAQARSQIEAISSNLIASSAADPIQQEAMERVLVPDKIIEILFSLSFRGAALVTVFFLLFINRQIAFIMARLIMKKQENVNGDLIRFHVPQKTIWVFSLCLPVIVACGIFSLKYIGIAAWNVLIICVILFLAQGGGIVLHYLVRRPIPVFMRLLGSLLFVLLVFSPGINLAVIAALVILGIAENWLPLRRNEELGIKN
jgi:hypothetical protein